MSVKKYTPAQALAVAIALAAEGHKNQFDKGGNPYILHPIWVMNNTETDNLCVKAAAILHDYLEDVEGATEDHLIDLGLFPQTVELVKLLTKQKGVSEDLYYERICSNPWATMIKMADLKHNSDITRLKGLTDKDFTRMQKYALRFTQLKNSLKGI